jgi:DNA repair exonuclease SbcCD ATPase subunit
VKPLRLYIENFMCHENSFIDFTQFNSALIVGKVDNNELYSNGVGKTTIFKALEYVLFNQADVNLEKIIRDGCDSCTITLDFIVDDIEYRISRKRTKKSTDFSLYERTSEDGSDTDVYHQLIDNSTTIYKPVSIDKDNKFWKDKSGSRASDTEKDVDKLIKVNYKSFRSTIHFIQNDFGGLATSTPEKRKGILKDALNIIIYSKLEKLAKEEYSLLSKEIDKSKIVLDTLGDPLGDIKMFENQISSLDDLIMQKTEALNKVKTEIDDLNNEINKQSGLHSSLESKFSDLLSKKKTLELEKSKLEISVKEYTSKKSNASKAAKDIIEEVRNLKEQQSKLIEIDFSQIDILTESLSVKKHKITELNLIIQQSVNKCEELKVPMPNDSVCKHCRQTLSEQHKVECQNQIDKELEFCENLVKDSKKEIQQINVDIQKDQQTINSLSLSKKQLENINISISSKNKEIQDKKVLYTEYSDLLDKFVKELKNKTEDIVKVEEDLKNSSMSEATTVQSIIDDLRKKLFTLNSNVNSFIKELTQANSSKAVIQHNIEQKNKDSVKIKDIKSELLKLEEESEMYPDVIQAFSTTGIPNLIIQNVLDDLQIEANNLLTQLKPGLQLSFFVEKTVEKTKDVTDTLEINYHINGKERYYEQLSGAQKIAITFSLKLGLSFLLQKIIGTDIKFLMLDEIDQSLDKASVDAFADIVKFFQKEFTILVITHNDRLKDKFNHAILVEQDINMVSRASVVSSW